MTTSPADDLPAMCSPQQLADFLGVPLETVRKWRAQGDGPPAHKIGKHLRYARRDVAVWLNASRS